MSFANHPAQGRCELRMTWASPRMTCGGWMELPCALRDRRAWRPSSLCAAAWATPVSGMTAAETSCRGNPRKERANTPIVGIAYLSTCRGEVGTAYAKGTRDTSRVSRRSVCTTSRRIGKLCRRPNAKPSRRSTTQGANATTSLDSDTRRASFCCTAGGGSLRMAKSSVVM